MTVWTKEAIKEKMIADDRWTIRGLVAIYNRQTDDEKNDGLTKHENGIGFNGVDSAILSDMARQYVERKFLTNRQIVIVRKKMLKYAGQLANIANEQQA